MNWLVSQIKTTDFKVARPWCWEGLGAEGEGDDRGWDGWMASQTRWAWVWVNSGSWWWTGMPGVLQFMGLQRVRHDWATELNWIPKDTCIPAFIVAPFTVAKTWKQPWHLSTNEWIQKMCIYIQKNVTQT